MDETKIKKYIIIALSGLALLAVVLFTALMIKKNKNEELAATASVNLAASDSEALNISSNVSSEAIENAVNASISDSNQENSDNDTSNQDASNQEDYNSSDSDNQVAASEAAGSVTDFYANIKEGSSWGDNPVYTQLDISIINSSSMDVSGWVLTVNVGENAAVDTSWSGNYSIDKGILTVTPVDYNTLISAGQRADIGLILTGISGDLSYTLSGNETVTSGTASESSAANNQSSNSNYQTSQTTAVSNPGALEVPEKSTDDWLHTDGKNILDASGKKVWLTGVNWFGYNTGTNTFDGLWNSDLNQSIQAIANHGFNIIRIPISAELILQWKAGQAPDANFNQATNSYLVGMDSLEIFDYVVGQCRACGLKLMIDIHSAETNASGHNVNLWTTSNISTAQYQEALCYMAARYKDDDTIVAYDLKNEPHGKPYEGDGAAIWNDSEDSNNWKYVAEETALMVLEENPNVLIMVEGTEIYPVDIKTNGDYSSTDDDDYYFNWWGGNLRGVKDYPIELGKYQNKLVYSPHDYGPTVYAQPWFEGSYDFDSLMEDCWGDNWFYIYEDNIAPLLIGEWGGFMTEPNLTWMTYMRQLIKENHLNHTFWCFNANSGDTGGLVLDDFTTWDETKYAFVKEVLWQENGKFVGLDHEIPLGTEGNGITLSEASGL